MKVNSRLVGPFEEDYESVMYTIRYHRVYHMLETVPRFATLRVSDSSPNKHVNVHIKQVYKTTLQRGLINNDGNCKRTGNKLQDGAIIRRKAG